MRSWETFPFKKDTDHFNVDNSVGGKSLYKSPEKILGLIECRNTLNRCLKKLITVSISLGA